MRLSRAPVKPDENAAVIMARAFLRSRPDAFIRALEDLMRQVRLETETVKESYPPPEEIACFNGCSYCCRLRVEISIPELLHLAHNILELTEPQNLKILVQKIAHELEISTRADDHRPMSMRLACPVLEEDSCRYYQARPLACQACNSLDTAECAKAFELNRPDWLVTRYIPQHRIAMTARAALQYGSSALGRKPVLIELRTGLGLALARKQPVRDWLENRLQFPGEKPPLQGC